MKTNKKYLPTRPYLGRFVRTFSSKWAYLRNVGALKVHRGNFMAWRNNRRGKTCNGAETASIWFRFSSSFRFDGRALADPSTEQPLRRLKYGM